MTNRTDTISLKINWVKTSLSLLGSLAFVTLGGWLIISSDSAGRIIIGALIITFFGLGIVIFSTALLGNGTAVIIDSVGIHSKLTYPKGLIPWDNIRSVDIGSTYLSVKLDDPKVYLNNLKWISKWFAYGNHYLMGSPATISIQLLRVSDEELADIILTMQRTYRS